MSVQDAATQLISYASNFNTNTMGASNFTAETISLAIERLQIVRRRNAESVTMAINTLGGNHPGVEAIAKMAAALGSKISQVEGMLEGALSELTNMDTLINNQSLGIAAVGNAIMRSGG